MPALTTRPSTRDLDRRLAGINQPVRAFLNRLIHGPAQPAPVPSEEEMRRMIGHSAAALALAQQRRNTRPARTARRHARAASRREGELAFFAGAKAELAARMAVPALRRLNAAGDQVTSLDRRPAVLDGNHPDAKSWAATDRMRDYLLPIPAQENARALARQAETLLRREEAHLRALANEAVGDRPGAAEFLETETQGTDAVVGGAETLATAAKDADPRQNDPAQGLANSIGTKVDGLRTTADLARERVQELLLEESDVRESARNEEEERRRRENGNGRSSLGL